MLAGELLVDCVAEEGDPVGPQGIPGAAGSVKPQGVQGPAGEQGPPGPFPASLPSGKTLTGVYRTEVVNMVGLEDTESFAFPLASRPTVHFVGIGTTAPAQCPGTVSDPKAAPGNLCVYAALGASGANVVEISDPETNLAGASPRGFTVAGSTSSGSWAVTAPLVVPSASCVCAHNTTAVHFGGDGP